MDSPPRERDETQPADKPRSTGRRFSAPLWIGTALLGIAMLSFLVPVALTASPRQCAACHEMKPYYDSWQSSSHRGAVHNCLQCHLKPGVTYYMAFEYCFYHMVSAHLAGTQVRTTDANSPAVVSCVRDGCHSLNREVSNSADLKINHRLHVVSAKIACPTCHPGAVHAGVGGRLKLPPMKLCKQCHADKMTDCGYCHVQEHLQAQPGTH